MSFNEARDAISQLMDNNERFKTDRERALFLQGLKVGILGGQPLQDEKEVETFLDAIDLHLKLYPLEAS